MPVFCTVISMLIHTVTCFGIMCVHLAHLSCVQSNKDYGRTDILSDSRHKYFHSPNRVYSGK
jgi:hypothetical protein